MTLIRSFEETVITRFERDAEFHDVLLREEMDVYSLQMWIKVSPVLRDYINCKCSNLI
jgi:hypothetical protein